MADIVGRRSRRASDSLRADQRIPRIGPARPPGSRRWPGALNEIAIDKRYVRPDGTAVWVHVSMSPLLDDQGRSKGWSRSSRTSPNATRPNTGCAPASRYRSLVDASMAIAWTADATGGFARRRNHGRPYRQDAASYTGWAGAAAIHPEDRARLRHCGATCSRTRAP